MPVVGFMHILSPYAGDRSALTDCVKLLESGLTGRKAVVIYGFDYPNLPMDPAVEAFGETGQLLHLGHWHARRADSSRRAAGADDLDARRVQPAGEIREPGLVVDADQRALDGYPRHRPSLTFRPWTDQPARAIRPTVSTSRERSATFTLSVSTAGSSRRILPLRCCSSCP